MTVRLDRRGFVRGVAAALCAGAGGAFFPHAGLVRSALASSSKGSQDYRALVCVYLAGGNDSFNLLVPRDSADAGSRYGTYSTSRGGVYSSGNPLGLAHDFNALINLGTPLVGPGFAFGLHPDAGDYAANGFAHPGLGTLFAQKKLSFVANVGTLIEPVTKSQFSDGVPNPGQPIPAQLYSHSDQEMLWHLADASGTGRTGWGGRLMDTLDIASQSGLSPCISVAGNARFQIGQSVFPYQMSASSGVTKLDHFNNASSYGPSRRAALDAMLAQASSHVMVDEYRRVLLRADEVASALSLALASDAGRIDAPYDYRGNDAPNPSTGFYPEANLAFLGDDYANPLLDQLRMVARMIKASRDQGAGINQSRQIYYVRLDGFDTHGEQWKRHPVLIARLSQALGWFWQALGEIGAQDDVTTFTMSEFGRTLSSNGDGSDHAWGGVQFVLGGQVAGQGVYGSYPELVLDANNPGANDYSFGRGQYIPTTSNDQMAATLAKWLGGLSDGALADIFPNLQNFGGTPLGFLPS